MGKMEGKVRTEEGCSRQAKGPSRDECCGQEEVVGLDESSLGCEEEGRLARYLIVDHWHSCQRIQDFAQVATITPQGWTREYKVETMTNITRVKKGESIVSGKVLVTCTVTILGIGSHSGTGEEWADDDNGMTSADAQAFKRAYSCVGLGS